MTELWKTVVSYADYEVSNLGRVRRAVDVIVSMPNGGTAIRARAGQLLKIGCFQRRGDNLPYLRVTLQVRTGRGGTKTFLVHRLVAEAFVPNPGNKPVVNHINCDVSDSRAENLEWCTHKENCSHAALNGRQARPNPRIGVDQRSAKLTDDAVKQIRQMSAEGMSNAQVAKVFGVDRASISRIRNRILWRHIA